MTSMYRLKQKREKEKKELEGNKEMWSRER